MFGTYDFIVHTELFGFCLSVLQVQEILQLFKK